MNKCNRNKLTETETKGVNLAGRSAGQAEGSAAAGATTPPSGPPACLWDPRPYTSPPDRALSLLENRSPASLAWCQLPPEGGGGEMEAGPVGCSAMPLPFYGPASTSSPACEGRDNAMSFPVFPCPSPDMCSSGLALERGAPRVRALGHLGFSPQRQE